MKIKILQYHITNKEGYTIEKRNIKHYTTKDKLEVFRARVKNVFLQKGIKTDVGFIYEER